MTLVGLDYLGKQEIERHNRATEDIAIGDRISRESIARQDRASRESIARDDRQSREGIASLDRQSKASIASLDRQSKASIAKADRESKEDIAKADRDSRFTIAEADRSQKHFDNRYAADAKLIQHSDLNKAVASVVSKDWFNANMYGNPSNDSLTVPGLKVSFGAGRKSYTGGGGGFRKGSGAGRKF